MSTPNRPEGYREPTEEELMCLPAGAMFFDTDIKIWRPSSREGVESSYEGRYMAVPIAKNEHTGILPIIPAHYDKTVTPWDLERCMETSGNAFVDARRTDAIEYCFRMKGDLLGDLRKAKHCLEAAIQELESKNP